LKSHLDIKRLTSCPFFLSKLTATPV